jgi:hypothetical protein
MTTVDGKVTPTQSNAAAVPLASIIESRKATKPHGSLLRDADITEGQVVSPKNRLLRAASRRQLIHRIMRPFPFVDRSSTDHPRPILRNIVTSEEVTAAYERHWQARQAVSIRFTDASQWRIDVGSTIRRLLSRLAHSRKTE